MPDPVESRGRGDTSTFGSLATLSHTLLGWDQLPTQVFFQWRIGLYSSMGTEFLDDEKLLEMDGGDCCTTL